MSECLCDLLGGHRVIIFCTEPFLVSGGEFMVWGFSLVQCAREIAAMTVDIEMFRNVLKDTLLVSSPLFEQKHSRRLSGIDHHRSLFAPFPTSYFHRRLASMLRIMFTDIPYLEHRDLRSEERRV